MAEDRIYTVEEASELALDEILDLHRTYVNETLVDLIAGARDTFVGGDPSSLRSSG